MDVDRTKKTTKYRSLSDIIRASTGQRFSGTFYCDLCSRKFISGYLYNYKGREYEICKYCRSNVIEKASDYTVILSTPMGNKR